MYADLIAIAYAATSFACCAWAVACLLERRWLLAALGSGLASLFAYTACCLVL